MRRILPVLITFILSQQVLAYPSFTDKTYDEEAFPITRLVEGLESGWGIAAMGDDAIIVGEWKSGTVWHIDLVEKRIIPILENNEIYNRGQAGQLGVWVDREFEKHPYVYVAKSMDIGGLTSTELVRYNYDNKKLVNPKSLLIASPFVKASHHFGGAITQDEQGLLYLSVGDRGQKAQAQKLDNHQGKILVMDREGNPKGLDGGYVFSYGQRNPQGLYYSVEKKMLLEAEHGPRGGDEVNHIELGKNYGWPVITYGKNYIGTTIGDGITEKEGMEQPLYYYVPSIATSSVLLYEYNAIPGLTGKLLVGSLKENIVSVLEKDAGGKWKESARLFEKLGERWRGMTVNPKGRVFLVTQNGHLYVVGQ